MCQANIDLGIVRLAHYINVRIQNAILFSIFLEVDDYLVECRSAADCMRTDFDAFIHIKFVPFVRVGICFFYFHGKFNP